jgi:hypothetical protein
MTIAKGTATNIIDNLSSIAGGATSAASTSVDTSNSVQNGIEITYTVGVCTTNPIAQIQVFSSVDNVTFDTLPCSTYDVVCVSGGTGVIQSFTINVPLRYYNVKVKNNDASVAITAVTVKAQNQLVS